MRVLGCRLPLPQVPQFVFEEFLVESDEGGWDDNQPTRVRIVTYTSLVESPRLLKSNQLEEIAAGLARRVNREFELVVVGPSRLHESSHIRRLDFMKRLEFLRLLSSSDVFLERCTDEELGIGSLEAGIQNVPVAKIADDRS